jgi:hypothetical protein
MTGELDLPLMARVIARALRVADKHPTELVTALANETHLICETANLLDQLGRRCTGPNAPHAPCVWCGLWKQLHDVASAPETYTQAQHEQALQYVRVALEIPQH